MTTLNDLVQRTITRLSMVNGTSVQTYAEDRIASYIQDKFNALFDEAWWDQFVDRITLTLDGVSGTHTGDLSLLVKRYQDIQKVFPEGSDKCLTRLPTTINAARLSGGTPIYISAQPNMNKVFRVYPINAIGNINIVYRTKPDRFLPNDIVNFDEDALVLGAAYDYASDDATNPMQVDKLKVMFESRVLQLKEALMDVATTLDPMFPDAANSCWLS